MSKEKKWREFKLSSYSIDNRTFVLVLTFIILLGGLMAYKNMPKENFPEIVMPEIYVGTPYPGNSAKDIQKLITHPFEKELKSINGVDKISSTSIEGFSTIQVKFNFDVKPSEALRKVKDAIDKARGDKDFPKDLPAEPNIMEINFAEFPIMNINISGDYSLKELKKYGEYLEDRIEPLQQISKVDIRGIQEEEVEIQLNTFKMEARNVSYADVENAISGTNITLSAGDILNDGIRRNLRVIGEFKSIDDIRNVIVKQEDYDIIYVKDIAEVKFEPKDATSFAREFGNPVVSLDVVKRSGQNLLEASDEINKIVADARENYFPSNLSVTLTNDQSDNTRNQVANLENSIISGVILVVLVLFFFLGLRNALFVGIAIPLSMLMGFLILNSLGITINMIVLFSLILALGMLVDNGIVIVENIYRWREEGVDLITAAKRGVGEVAVPIISSTATTLAAFIPLAMWPGMMGEFMFYLPITLIIVLSSSLFVALVINPVLAAIYMKNDNPNPDKKKAVRRSLILFGVAIPFYFFAVVVANLLVTVGVLILLYMFVMLPIATSFQSKSLPKLENAYEKFIEKALNGKNPRKYILATFFMLIFSFVLMGIFTPKVEFFPSNLPNYVNVFLEMPVGTDISEMNSKTKIVEEKIANHLKAYEREKEVNGVKTQKNFLISSIISQVGEGTSDPSAGPSFGSTPNKARVTISFVTYENRTDPKTGEKVNTSDVMADIRNQLQGIVGVKVVVDKNNDGPPQGKAINIEIIGEDFDSLLVHAQDIKLFVDNSNISGIEELSLDIETNKPELIVKIDQEKARRYNLNSYQIGMAIRTALFGKEVSVYKENEDDYPINLRFADEYRNDLATVMDQKITFRNNMGQLRQVPISAVAEVSRNTTYNSVKGKDLDKVVTISSNVLNGYNANEVVENIKTALETYQVKKGTEVKFTGQQEEQEKEMGFLSKALLIAVALILLIIIGQFNALSAPFIIFSSVVFSLIGVFLGLVIFQMDFIIIMTMIGIISLAGVVVNNAIVLIDYAGLLITQKKEEEGRPENTPLSLDEMRLVLKEAGKKRLRPVLLTAITTVLGLIPLAIGLNIDFIGLYTNFAPNIYMGGDNTVFWGPMSWTVIFGLTFATFLTLVIVPTMYFFVYRIKLRFGRG